MLFSFRNAFDDVTVSIDDESIDSSGPFTVKIEHGDESCDPGRTESWVFSTVREAQAKFNDLLSEEIGSVLADRITASLTPNMGEVADHIRRNPDAFDPV